jgi:hypothetical protein
VPILSEEEKAQRAADTAVTGINAKIEAARRLAPQLVANGMASNLQEALALATDYFGLYTSPSSRSASGGVRAIPGHDKDGNPVMGVFDAASRAFVYPTGHEKAGQPIPGFMQRGATDTMSYGQLRETLAKTMFGANFGQLDQVQQQQVLDEEKLQLQSQSKSRALGTEQGQFQGPIDVSTAQRTGTQVGASSADYAGQNIPQAGINERRRSLEALQATITRMMKPQPQTGNPQAFSHSLLDVLPSANELAGIAPNAIIALRRRANTPSGLVDESGRALTYREAMARLDSNLNSIVNVLARVKDEQRGTQTEKDADRAMAALLDIQGKLNDPLAGDTRESAVARMNEAMDSLNRIMAGLPGAPVPNQQRSTPPAAPAAAPAAGGNPTLQNGPRYYQNAAGEWVLTDPNTTRP